jgi:transcriptional regulator with XRE-family HTH domain
MARSGSLATVEQERLTPFGRLLYDYLLSFRPTKTVPEFAREVGVSAQAVWDWLRAGTLPRRATLVLISERVPDLPLDELLAAAGLPTTAQVRRERLAHLDMLRASIDEVMALVNADPAYSESDRVVIRRFLERKPSEFVTVTDTWREYHHESPTAFTASQSEEHAAVFEPAPIRSPEEAHGLPRRRHPTEGPHGQGGQPSRRTTGA